MRGAQKRRHLQNALPIGTVTKTWNERRLCLLTVPRLGIAKWGDNVRTIMHGRAFEKFRTFAKHVEIMSYRTCWTKTLPTVFLQPLDQLRVFTSAYAPTENPHVPSPGGASYVCKPCDWQVWSCWLCANRFGLSAWICPKHLIESIGLNCGPLLLHMVFPNIWFG